MMAIALLSAIAGAVSALAIAAAVHAARTYRARRRPATSNVYSGAMAENTAQARPHTADRTNHTGPARSATQRPATQYSEAIRLQPGAGRITINGTPIPPEHPAAGEFARLINAAGMGPGDELAGLSDAELVAAARQAIARWKMAAGQYKSITETLEPALAEARQEAAGQRARADRLQSLYTQRTQDALRAGMRIVIDYCDRNRPNE